MTKEKHEYFKKVRYKTNTLNTMQSLPLRQWRKEAAAMVTSFTSFSFVLSHTQLTSTDLY